MLRGIFGWPGQLVVRVRERGIASAQEAVDEWEIGKQLPVVPPRRDDPDNKLSGPPEKAKPKQASKNLSLEIESSALRRLILPALLLLGIMSLRADDTPPPDAISAPITDPVLVGEHYREVLARPQFQETDESPVNTRFEDWLSQWFKQLGAKFGEFKYANRMPAFESLLMTLLVVFSITILLYIMVRLTRRRSGMEPEADTGIPGQKTFRPPEFYDQEIQQALRVGDWHTAWLAAWRQFLSRLEHRHLVEADRTRTNREYLAQLRGKPLPASALALLTGMVDAYDRFIYGRKSIGEPDWNLFHRQIDEAGLLLHLDDKRASAQANPNAS